VNAPRVIGLDLSLTGTGIAYHDGEMTTVTTKTSDRDSRLLAIEWAIHIAIGTEVDGPPVADLAVIEDLPTHAHGSGITGMVQGVARTVLLKATVPYALIPGATLKKYATGRGNATKADMRMALFQRAGIDERDDNRVDAWWLRAAGLEHLGHPIVDLPKAQREALAKVAWPELVSA
jgi:Holliday junction resolvasome RuvABC endonuclease subunit